MEWWNSLIPYVPKKMTTGLSGLITFDKLRPEVERVQLVLHDIVYRFDAFNRPADIATAVFNFERIIDRVVITPEMKQAELEREKVRIRMAGPQQIVNNRVNDNARNAFAIDRILETNSPQMEECFIQRNRRDEVDPGTWFFLSLLVQMVRYYLKM